MRSDLKFPPIIDSNGFKQNKYLGLCERIVAPSDAPKPMEDNTPTNASTPIATSGIVTSTLFDSQMMQSSTNIPPSPGIISLQPSTGFIPIPPPIGVIPPPPPGVIPPPPPISIAGLYKQSDQKRKEDEANPQPVQVSYQEPDISTSSTGNDMRDQLSRALAARTGGATQIAPPSAQQQTEEPRRRKNISNDLVTKVTSGGFFDDDDGQPLLLRKSVVAAPTQLNASNIEPPRNQVQGAPSGSMLDSILAKGAAPAPRQQAEEDNPFSKQRPGKLNKKPALFDEEDDEAQSGTVSTKKDKLSKMMLEDSDDESKRKKLIEKYGGGEKRKNRLLEMEEEEQNVSTKINNGAKQDAPSKPNDKTKKGGWEESDEDIKPPPRKKPKIEDDEDEIPKPKKKPIKKVESDEDEVPKLPSKQEEPNKKSLAKKLDSDQNESKLAVKKEVPLPKKEDPKVEAIKNPTASAEEQEAGYSPPKRESIKNMDFISKLNSQLGGGPKTGIGLIKSVVGDDLDLASRKASGEDEEEFSLLPKVYTSNRGSVIDRGSIKPIAGSYFEQGNEDENSPKKEVEVTMKKRTDSEVNGEGSNRPSLKKPEPPKPAITATNPAPKEAGPTMLRGVKKDPFANASDSDDNAQKLPTKPKQLDLPKEVPKIEAAPPAMLRGKKKGAFDKSSEEDAPPLPKASPPAPSRKNKLLEDDNSESRQSKPQKREENKPDTKKKPKIEDSEEEPPKKRVEKGGKKMALLASSDEEIPRPKKPAVKKNTIQDSDDDMPKKPVTKASATPGGKKKLFDDDD